GSPRDGAGRAARPWQLSCLEQLNAVKTLPRNWDSYGSPPLSDVAYQQACQLIAAVAVDQLPAPHAGPESGGAVQIDWQLGGRALEVHFLADGTATALQVEHDEVIAETELPPSALETWQSLFDWLQASE
ncbi:MAG TPA: hypothetical protein VK137_20190, partial [Planctomycetaceae bacterium]|nr:hypothetical protein [Planctomycetaceae bacterium]